MKTLITNENGKVILQTNQPSDKQKEKGIQVESVPEPDYSKGTKAILYVDENNELYYEYVGKSELEEMKEDQADQWEEILLGGE